MTAQCLCDKLPTGSICVFCAYAQGFPAKLYRSGRRYDEAAIPSHWCVDCGKQVKTVFSRCYDCRVKQAVRR